MREPLTIARAYRDETEMQKDIQELRAYGYKQEDIHAYEERLKNGEYVLVVRDTTRDSHHPWI